MFVKTLPSAVKKNLVDINKKKELKLTFDHNTTLELVKKMGALVKSCPFDEMTKQTRRKKCKGFLIILANLLVNFLEVVLYNLHVILFNYFSPFLGLAIQCFGFYAQTGALDKFEK
tara:strand:- start:78 stop:425 length:348 start_codon:yes stop_codon:yes gene_type:complete